MKCKYCNEEMVDGVTVCPACGGDNARPQKKNWIPVIAVICCVALIVGIAVMIIGMNTFPETQTGDVTLKGSYTGSDFDAQLRANTVVAKAGDLELTNGQLQVVYWSTVYDFLDYLGDYAGYYIDFTKPLSEQYYNKDTGITWEHYFLGMAINVWHRYEVLTVKAEQAGITLDAETQNSLDNMRNIMEFSLKETGFDSVEDMLHHDFGNAATFDNYMDYMNSYYRGNNYYNLLYNEVELTEDEIQTYYTENEEMLVNAGCGKEVGTVVNARHILIEPAGKTDEAVEAARKTAQDMMDKWVDEGANEEAFANLAYEHSACPSYANGGLLSPFTKGQMVEPFEAWCFAEGRQYGDYGLVQTEYGWHIIFFVNSYEPWREASVSNLTSERLYEVMAVMEEDYPLIVDYSRIVLADVPLV